MKFFKYRITWKKKTLVGIDLNTFFTNKLDNEFNVYTSEKFFPLNNNIDNAIISKVKEIINDPNSKYKNYSNYYKIGKFVHSHITYDDDYSGRELTPLEIFNQKRGVDEHYIQNN